MSNNFQVMRVHHKMKNASYQVHLVLPQGDGAVVDATPVRNEDGSFTMQIVQPSDDTRHAALGKFMGEWSNLEITLSFLVSNVTQTPLDTVRALTNALGTRGQVDVLKALAPNRIKSKNLDKLASILDRIKTNNTKRNHIVHGHWMLEILVINQGGVPALRYHQYREYEPSDKEQREQIGDLTNRRIRSKYLFSVIRINAISREIGRLRTDIEKFNTHCFPLTEKPVQQPVNITVGKPVSG